ncbi:MAG: REP-associated tyrosine transposase, partial [Planctomycetaceae bacterium]
RFPPPGPTTIATRTEPIPLGRAALRNELSGPVRGGRAASRVARSGTFWLALGGTVLVLAYGGRAPGRVRRATALALGGLALVELGLYGRALVRVAPADRFLGPDPISAALARAEPPVPGPFRIRARDILYSDLNAWSNGFEKVNINDSFQIRHAADLFQTLYPLLYVTPPPDPDEVMGEAVARFHRDVRQGVLDRLGVAFLVSDHVEPDWPLVASGTWRGSRFTVHRNPTAMPRAYVVPRAQIAADDPATALALFRWIDPREAVLMPRDPLGPGDGPRQPFTTASYDATGPDRVVVRVATEAPGLLVIADTWLPGWTAQVDGRAAPILRGNHAQRVIPLPHPGRHEIVLRYEPPGFWLGLALTGLSALAWPAASIYAGRIRTRRTIGRTRHDHEARSESESMDQVPELSGAASQEGDLSRAISGTNSPRTRPTGCAIPRPKTPVRMGLPDVTVRTGKVFNRGGWLGFACEPQNEGYAPKDPGDHLSRRTRCRSLARMGRIEHPHRRSFDMAGHAHELTFTCYRRHRFLKAERTCRWLAESLEQARARWGFDLWAYVFMPEHTHLIVRPRGPEATVATILKAIKQPVGRRAILYLESHAPGWLPRMTRKRGGKIERLFWQSGGCYDRNLVEPRVLLAAMDYLHLNPVRRGLVERASDWRWSSAGWYEGIPQNELRPDQIPPEWCQD